ncbi:hypothetical protein CPC08DRAFT_767833 [Agrocybe pediades]|nr:hypothetical protein CPC08DRAFT_767833 [Agrocybe pediades]
MSHKRNRSSISQGLLTRALAVMEELAASSKEEGGERGPLMERLEAICTELRERAEQAKISSLSSLLFEDLLEMGIQQGPDLRSKTTGLPQSTEKVGTPWTEELLLAHLAFLRRHVPNKNEELARRLIFAFVDRAVVIIEETCKDVGVIVSIEQVVPSVTISKTSRNSLQGKIGYVSISPPEQYLSHPHLVALCGIEKSTFFVTEAKGPDQILENHVPQAVGEMYSCARTLKKKIVRGALTNGWEWLWIILEVSPSGGGRYSLSQPITVQGPGDTGEKVIYPKAVSGVASVLAHWMLHGSEDLIECDYYTYTVPIPS